MDLTPFAPATRRDGWSPELKMRFLDHLAARGTVRGACALVGLSREAAYRLRRRDPLFARAWAAALGLARENGADVLTACAIDGIEEEVWYRGELVGTRRRFDSRLLLAHLARLDKLVQETPAGDDAERFDELLALIAGEQAPEEIAHPDDPLPPCRAAAADLAADMAENERRHGEPEEDYRGLASEEIEQHLLAIEDACAAEAEQARAEALAHWDAWFRRACERVDAALGGEADVSPRTVSTVSTSGVGEELLSNSG
jgi:hypothetical protein